ALVMWRVSVRAMARLLGLAMPRAKPGRRSAGTLAVPVGRTPVPAVRRWGRVVPLPVVPAGLVRAGLAAPVTWLGPVGRAMPRARTGLGSAGVRLASGPVGRMTLRVMAGLRRLV